MSAVAIVPARGGSKRIPRKNIRLFLGRPILGRVLGELRAAACFDEIMVSTEDREIANLAVSHGAKVPFLRSSENSGDTATTAAVLLEVLAAYRAAGREFSHVCCVYPTAVFVTPGLLEKGLKTLEASRADSVVCVVRFTTPIERAMRIEDGKLRMCQPEFIHSRSVDITPTYHDAGQFYWLRTAAFLEEQEIFMRRTVPLILDEVSAQDIDNEEDWQMAELKYSHRQSRKGQ